jgi:hypothetical protein
MGLISSGREMKFFLVERGLSSLFEKFSFDLGGISPSGILHMLVNKNM